ncbi:TlpA family protein disulfide reductase [Mangrovimonas xylaniphaga]|uniref:TlpA family protein disulfide reductase n=1 Tax=Mangrovimonas xylaniphaga TaxID=1645915 RepID=UPI0006B45633|nr:TlpA disulfide reductase family protein [Mangrovimonas xylaniphaga]
MKLNKSQKQNIVFLILLVLLLVPQTRFPIQLLLNKGLALFGPSVQDVEDREVLSTYNWKLEDNTGEILNFETCKGKVVLVNFWATWCPPCIAEMDSLEALYETYKDEVVFIFVSTEDDAVVTEFLKKKDYSFKAYKPLQAPPNNFEVSTIPRTFLIDKNGAIVIDKTGAANWNSDTVKEQIESLLGNE